MEEVICRLCLQTIGINNFQPVEESLLKLNINISKENVMCIECANRLRVLFTFSPGRAYMEDQILPVSDLDLGLKLEPEAIEITTNPKSLIKTEIECSFCTKAHGKADLISLWESKENKFMLDMLEKYISEMNLKITEELLACEACHESLNGVLSVILKCLKVEENISKYIKIEDTDDKGQVELKKVQQFQFKPILKSEIESFDINESEDRSDQVQEKYTTMAEAKIKHEKKICNTEVIIKTEDDVTLEQNDCNIPDIKSEQSDCDDKARNTIEKSREKIEENEPLIQNRGPSKIKMYKCEICSYSARRKGTIKKHLLTHKSPSETKMFQCELCPYKSKRKAHLRRHSLTHKSPSEINMFKCASCLYETKRRCNLQQHLLTHANLSGIKMFKCEICPYKAKRKAHLRRHSLMHKSPSEINMFKCELCSYEAKFKKYLKKHLLTHKNSSEINMFKCELCSYEAKRKSHLKIHLLTHKIPSEIKMFQCESCPYEAKQKSHLRQHSLTHKSPSEINMFKCELCSYEAKQKCHLKKHLLSHANLSEMHNLLAHANPSGTKTFQCEMCPYVSKRKHIFNDTH